jgi:hypothetical protein
MAAKRDPKNSWEQTYGYTNPDGRFAPGDWLKKKKEIDWYFKNADHPHHHDFRDFFSALGVLEGSLGYSSHREGSGYKGIYQMGIKQLDYMDFFNTYGKRLGVRNMEDFQKNPIAQEAAGLLSFMGTPGGEGVSRFRATAKAVNDADFERLASGGGTFCKVTFVDRNNKGWEKTVEIKINYASVSAAAHLVGQGAMAENLKKVIAGYKLNTPAKIDINDPHAHDGNNVLFTAYLQLT